MKISKLTSKFQATVPSDVRAALGVAAGDALAWEVEDGMVRVRKAQPIDLAFAASVSATLDEWMSDADEEAYGNL